jgi:hypothetical protein
MLPPKTEIKPAFTFKTNWGDKEKNNRTRISSMLDIASSNDVTQFGHPGSCEGRKTNTTYQEELAQLQAARGELIRQRKTDVAEYFKLYDQRDRLFAEAFQIPTQSTVDLERLRPKRSFLDRLRPTPVAGPVLPDEQQRKRNLNQQAEEITAKTVRLSTRVLNTEQQLRNNRYESMAKWAAIHRQVERPSVPEADRATWTTPRDGDWVLMPPPSVTTLRRFLPH